MSNAIELSVETNAANGAPSMHASVKQYVADGFTGSGNTRTLTFSGDTPPTDGSIGLCFVVINISTGLSYQSGSYQRLLYWDDHSAGVAEVNGGSGFSTVKVPNWSFVADAS